MDDGGDLSGSYKIYDILGGFNDEHGVLRVQEVNITNWTIANFNGIGTYHYPWYADSRTLRYVCKYE
jgi:hypothetical protein